MINVNLTDYAQVICFWLVFIRWGAIIFQLPLFDNVSVPIVVKTLFTLIVAYAFYPSVKNEVGKDISYLGIDNFWALTIFYLVIGLLIGYMVKALLDLFTSSGSIINQQIGFGAVHYFDPSSSSQIGPFERLVQWTMVIIIISSGALIPMFKGIYTSFFSIHVYDIGKMAKSPIFFIETFKGIFLAALMLASPLIFTNMLITTILGIIARTVPQMNIIMVSFVVNIGLGLLVFAASSNEFFQVAFRIYTDKLGRWFQFII